MSDRQPRYLAITPPRAELYKRIDRRVEAMVQEGLLDEVRELLARGLRADDPGMKTVGYVEAIDHISGRIDLAEMIAAIQQATRRYAKRQMTWLRKVEGVQWFDQPDVDAAIEYLFKS